MQAQAANVVLWSKRVCAAGGGAYVAQVTKTFEQPVKSMFMLDLIGGATKDCDAPIGFKNCHFAGAWGHTPLSFWRCRTGRSDVVFKVACADLTDTMWGKRAAGISALLLEVDCV